ncbi:AAA family ATPase [Pseudaeromonas paramecii]|uniref:AAA family ATPase n=1 Tax=Pseudaeromonas paramecii TaxID=2138166 RepID=A0ABP8Q6Y9_9GAMM
MPHATLEQILTDLDTVILGKPRVLRLALCCLLARGHLLLEDLPGMGKTSLSQALASVLGLSFARVQFTADLLPADLLGLSIFDPQQQSFVFHPGPLFTQVLLADEINRGSPRTQSALLEAMAEGQISQDGVTRPLPDPYFVIATQNPQEQTGTFPLPESQLDRFLMCLTLGYPDAQAERQMLLQPPKSQLPPRLDDEGLRRLQTLASQVHASPAALDYLLALVQASRADPQLPHALSPRASRGLLAAGRAWALLAGRDYLLPDDLQAVFPAVAEHRLRGAHGDSRQAEASLSQRLLERVDPVQ